MKNTKRTFLEIGFITLLALTGCGKKTADKTITRTEALQTLATIQANRKASGFTQEFDTFTVSTSDKKQNTVCYNSPKNYAISDDGLKIKADNTTVEKGDKSEKVVLYRHSNQYKYASEYRYIAKDDPTNVDRIYFIKKYENDSKEFLYKVDLTAKKYVQVGDNVEQEFETLVSSVRAEATTIINEQSDSLNAKNYFSSLPATLSEGNEEQYLKKNDNSVYLRATGHDGTPLISSGTQDLFLTRFIDNVCVSSYLHSNDSIYKPAAVEQFKFQGGYLNTYPVKPESFQMTIIEEQGQDSVVIKDDGIGGLKYENGGAVEGGTIDYSTGEFFVKAKECFMSSVSYQYENSNINALSYAAVFTDFEGAPANMPLSFTEENPDGTSVWQKVTSLD